MLWKSLRCLLKVAVTHRSPDKLNNLPSNLTQWPASLSLLYKVCPMVLLLARDGEKVVVSSGNVSPPSLFSICSDTHYTAASSGFGMCAVERGVTMVQNVMCISHVEITIKKKSIGQKEMCKSYNVQLIAFAFYMVLQIS